MTGCYFSIFLFIYSSLIQYIPTVASPPFTPMFSLPTSPLFQIHYSSNPLRGPPRDINKTQYKTKHDAIRIGTDPHIIG